MLCFYLNISSVKLAVNVPSQSSGTISSIGNPNSLDCPGFKGRESLKENLLTGKNLCTFLMSPSSFKNSTFISAILIIFATALAAGLWGVNQLSHISTKN